jgi:hypothetical protein
VRVLLLFVSLTATAAEVPVPKLPDGPIEMRVVHIVNPRLPRLSRARIYVLLAATARTAREHFGVELRFEQPLVEIPIAEVFAKIPPERVRAAREMIYDFKGGKGDQARLVRAFGTGLKESGEPLAGMIEYARPHIGPLRKASFETLGEALARLELERVEGWKNVRALDGGPAIDASPYNEYPMWLQLGYSDLPFEIIVTNQVIASVEYVYPAVHAAIRGGYSNGITTYNKSSRFQTVAIWSTFGFTTNDPWVTGMRAGETYEGQEAAVLAGIGAAHEIGHQLFHFSHPFGVRPCLMNPVEMFAYRAWAAQLSAKDCPIGSRPELRPGATKMLY